MLCNIRPTFSICKFLTSLLIMLYAASLYAGEEIIFIVNPTSGGGTCGRIWDSMESDIKKQVEQDGKTFKVFRTGIQGEKFIKSLKSGRMIGLPTIFIDAGDLVFSLMSTGEIELNKGHMTTIVSVGGDGTFSQIASTLHGKNRVDKIDYTLAVLPFVLGNSLAQGLNIPIEKTDAARERAVDIAINGQATLVGCFEVTSAKEACCSFVGLSFGVSCKIGTLQNEPPVILRPVFRRVSGKTQYNIAAVLAVINPPKTKVTVSMFQKRGDVTNQSDERIEIECQNYKFLLTNHVDEQCREEILHMRKLTFGVATVAPYFGGGFKIHPNAKVQGDKAYMSFIDDMNMFRKIRHFKHFKNGDHTKDSHAYSKTIELNAEVMLAIEAHGDSVIPFQIDGGENVGILPITIEWLPKSYKIKTMEGA